MLIRANSVTTPGFTPAAPRPLEPAPSRDEQPALPQETITWAAPPSSSSPPPAQLAPEAAARPAKRAAIASLSTAPMFMEEAAPVSEPTPTQSPISALIAREFEKHADNPAAQATLAKMSASDRDGLLKMASHPAMVDAFSAPGEHTSMTGVKHLAGLVTSGKILEKDKDGQSVYDHLQRLLHQDLAPELESERGTLFCELAANLNCTGEINQKNRGTCSPTTLEYLHAKILPADYARVVVGLASKEQKVVFQGGETLATNPTGLEADDSLRTNVDRIYQSSLMDHGPGSGTRYNNYDDAFYTVSGRRYRGSGMFDPQSGQLMAQIFGRNTIIINHEAGDRKKFEADAKRALNLGHPVWLGMSWDPDPDAMHSLHAMALVGFSEDKVYLRNPWGKDETGLSDSGEANGPARVVKGSDGIVELDKDVFFQHLKGSIRPSRPFYHVWANRIRYLIKGDQGIRQTPE